MNGVRTIFLRELRAGLVPDVILLLLALAVFTAVERVLVNGGELSEDAGQGVDLALFGCAALLSFASGARTFPREVKARRLLSLYTLPVSRGALLGALAGGRLAAVTLALAGLLLARPSILDTLAQGDLALGSLTPLLTLLPILFMAGVCSSLTFENNSPVYLIGYPVAIFSVVQALGLANAGFSSWRPAGFAVWLWMLSLAFLFLAFLALSWRFFRMGDFTVRRRSLAKQALVAISLVCAFGIIGAVSHSPLLAGCSGPWVQYQPLSNPYRWLEDEARPSSPGGRYLVVAEKPANRQGLSRLSIVETASGRVLAAQMWRDLRWASWSGQEQVLHLLVQDHWAPEPWSSLFEPQTAWIRLSPEGKELSRFRLGTIHGFAFLPDGADLIVNAIGDRIQLLALQNRSTPLVIEEIPWTTQWWPINVHSHSRGVLVFDALGSMWRAEHRKMRKIDPSKARESDPPAEIDVRWQEDMPALSLLTRSSKASTWEQRATGLASSGIPRSLLAPRWSTIYVRDDQRPAISPPEGLAVYLPTGGRDGLASLYDGALDREIPLPACAGGRATFPRLIGTESGPAFLVRFQCQAPVRVRHFYYLPGSGTVKPLPDLDRVMIREPVSLAYLDETSAIWRSDDNKTWTALRNGKLRTLWPVKP